MCSRSSVSTCCSPSSAASSRAWEPSCAAVALDAGASARCSAPSAGCSRTSTPSTATRLTQAHGLTTSRLLHHPIDLVQDLPELSPCWCHPGRQGADAGWTYGHLQLSTRGRYDVPAWRPLRVGTAPPAVAKRPPHRAADPARELSSTRLTSLRIFRSSPHAGASFTRSASGRLVHLPAPRGSGGAWRPGRLVAARPSCSSPFPRAHALIPGSPPRGCTNGSPPARAASTVVDG